MDLAAKLAIWEKQRAGLAARRASLLTRQEALDVERRQLEADEATLQPLETVMLDELVVVKAAVEAQAAEDAKLSVAPIADEIVKPIAEEIVK